MNCVVVQNAAYLGKTQEKRDKRKGNKLLNGEMSGNRSAERSRPTAKRRVVLPLRQSPLFDT